MADKDLPPDIPRSFRTQGFSDLRLGTLVLVIAVVAIVAVMVFVFLGQHF